MLYKIYDKTLFKAYKKENEKHKQKLLFHVGTEAGLFSELNNMMLAICYCHLNQIEFRLYADDANFTGGHGWEELFEPFCNISHYNMNRSGNYRHKGHFRFKRVILPNLLLRRFLLPHMIKHKENVDYLTQDIFQKLSSKKFLNCNIKWDLFHMDGKVKDEFPKLFPLVLAYKSTTEASIRKRIGQIHLPKEYISVQIRNGDKIVEYEQVYDAEYCLEKIQRHKLSDTSLFVFTDRYENVKYFKENTELKIYTLTKEDENGYYNEEFNSLSWEFKKEEIIKLLAMIEICLKSKMHFGYSGACTDDFISKIKPENEYVDMGTNQCLRKKNVKYFIIKFLKFK